VLPNIAGDTTTDEWDTKNGVVLRRYKAIGFCRRYRNVFLIASADGIAWDDSKSLEPIAVRANEGPFNVRIHEGSNRVALIPGGTVCQLLHGQLLRNARAGCIRCSD
jgi:hypothetical protein